MTLPSSRKQKGRRLQKWVAEKISELTGLSCGKDEEIESRPMGQSGTDVRLSENVRKIFKFSIECKNSESWSILPTIQQCKDNLYPNTEWLVFFAKNNIKPIVLLDAEVFFDILKHADLSLCGLGENDERARRRVSKAKEKVEKNKKSKVEKPTTKK